MSCLSQTAIIKIENPLESGIPEGEEPGNEQKNIRQHKQGVPPTN